MKQKTLEERVESLESLKTYAIAYGGAICLVLALLGFKIVPEEVNKQVQSRVRAEVEQRVGPQVLAEVEQRRQQIEKDESIADSAAKCFNTNEIVMLLKRIHINPVTGELFITANPELGDNGCTTTIVYGDKLHPRHVQFEQGGHIEDYEGPMGHAGPSKMLNPH